MNTNTFEQLVTLTTEAEDLLAQLRSVILSLSELRCGVTGDIDDYIRNVAEKYNGKVDKDDPHSIRLENGELTFTIREWYWTPIPLRYLPDEESWEDRDVVWQHTGSFYGRTIEEAMSEKKPDLRKKY